MSLACFQTFASSASNYARTKGFPVKAAALVLVC